MVSNAFRVALAAAAVLTPLKVWTREDVGAACAMPDGTSAMRAVCAIYRAQTADEQAGEYTTHSNGVGFSACHAKVGARLAKWMSGPQEDGIFRRRCGGFMWFRGERTSRLDVCRYIASVYVGQLAVVANAAEERASLKAHDVPMVASGHPEAIAFILTAPDKVASLEAVQLAQDSCENHRVMALSGMGARILDAMYLN